MGDWKVTTIGEDIAGIKPGKDGRSTDINPERARSGRPGNVGRDESNCLAR